MLGKRQPKDSKAAPKKKRKWEEEDDDSEGEANITKADLDAWEATMRQEEEEEKRQKEKQEREEREKLRKAREAEEERKRKEDDLAVRKKRIRKKFPDRKNVEKEYEDVSSEEEFELYFKKPRQLMDIFTELEEKNLFLIQNSQETEQALEELQQTFEHTKEVMGAKATQLRDSIAKLEANIEQEKKRCQYLRKSYDEKAGTSNQDAKLNDLAKKS